jgi:hypothetical protein
MSQSMPMDEPLGSLESRAAAIVEAEVLEVGPPPRVRVVRVKRGELNEGAEIVVFDCHRSLWKSIGEAMKAGLPTPSFSEPRLAGKPPEIRKGGRFVFYLTFSEGNWELAATNGWTRAQ